MEGQDFHTDKEVLDFKEIILQHLKSILNLSLSLNSSSIEGVHAYTNGVQCFSDVLLPFYDEEMTTEYSSYNEKFVVVKKETCDVKGNITDKSFYLKRMKEIHRELFRSLNLLMNRKDYLKSAIYEEAKKK